LMKKWEWAVQSSSSRRQAPLRERGTQTC
jgi:hypothetical protein